VSTEYMVSGVSAEYLVSGVSTEYLVMRARSTLPGEHGVPGQVSTEYWPGEHGVPGQVSTEYLAR